MKKLKLLAMSLAAIMAVSTVGMGDYTAVKGDDNYMRSKYIFRK